jgi:hypothetical protein
VVSPAPGTIIDYEKPTPRSVSDHTFGISPSDPMLLALLAAVQKCISSCGIEITNILHSQHQEAYLFQRGSEEIARINIAYKGKGKISAISPPVRSDFALELVRLLGPILGKDLSSVGTGPPKIVFVESFLQDFHNRLCTLLAGKDIAVQGVESFQFQQRYTFARDSEEVTFDIWYNGEQRFTKAQPSQSSLRFPRLKADVETILTDGLSS